MRTETKITIEEYARFRTSIGKYGVNEPYCVFAWASEPSTGSVRLDMSVEQAEELAGKLLDSVNEARKAEEVA